MRKLILTAVCLVSLVGLSYFLGTASGQAPAQPGGNGAAHRVGLIDMAVVFKEYPKFETLRNDLKAEVEGKEKEAKGMFEQIQEAQKLLKSGTLKAGSPEYLEKERELTHLTADFEAHRKQTQMELARKEAVIYHTINLEVNDMTRRVAKHLGYTLVMRFSREDLNGADPQKVAQGLSRQILYYQKEDDITDFVVKYLAKQYQQDAQKAPATTGGSRGASKIRQTKGTSEDR